MRVIRRCLVKCIDNVRDVCKTDAATMNETSGGMGPLQRGLVDFKGASFRNATLGTRGGGTGLRGRMGGGLLVGRMEMGLRLGRRGGEGGEVAGLLMVVRRGGGGGGGRVERLGSGRWGGGSWRRGRGRHRRRHTTIGSVRRRGRGDGGLQGGRGLGEGAQGGRERHVQGGLSGEGASGGGWAMVVGVLVKCGRR